MRLRHGGEREKGDAGRDNYFYVGAQARAARHRRVAVQFNRRFDEREPWSKRSMIPEPGNAAVLKAWNVPEIGRELRW